MKRVGQQYQLNEIHTKINDFETKRNNIQKELQDVEGKIAAAQGSISRLTLMKKSYNSEIEGITAKQQDINNEIDRLRKLIQSLTISINIDPNQVKELELKAQELNARLSQAVGQLNTQKDDLNSQINALHIKINGIIASQDKDQGNVTALIRELNLELNNCKRTEIMLQKFKEEYDVRILSLNPSNCLRSALKSLLSRYFDSIFS